MRICVIILLMAPLAFSKVKHMNSAENAIHQHKIKKYEPNWDSLDKRPLPSWYDKAKVGIFLHWGVFSVPSFGSEWFWYYLNGQIKNYVQFMEQNYPPGFTYQDFAPMFKAEFFDPQDWAKLFAKSGAKYVVLTTKHHEGYTLFPSHRSFSWNSVDVGPHKDLVGELSKAIRAEGLIFGTYHSMFEWFNPIYLADKSNQFKTQNFVETKLMPDLKQLINDYKPSILWSDGDGEAYDTYWNSTSFLAWLYNESPVKDDIVVNDRWGIGTSCKHGDFYNCYDRYNPGKLQNHKWENAFTIDTHSWGYRRNIDLNEVLSIDVILTDLVSTVSCGGNVLVNVGPTKEGTISPIFQDRLLSMGAWLATNGEAIYESSPWKHQKDSVNGDAWYTCRKTNYDGRRPTAKPRLGEEVNAIYAIFVRWPEDNVLQLHDITQEIQNKAYKVTILGNEDLNVQWEITNGSTWITLPKNVRSKNAWSLKFYRDTSPDTIVI